VRVIREHNTQKQSSPGGDFQACATQKIAVCCQESSWCSSPHHCTYSPTSTTKAGPTSTDNIGGTTCNNTYYLGSKEVVKLLLMAVATKILLLIGNLSQHPSSFSPSHSSHFLPLVYLWGVQCCQLEHLFRPI